MIFHIFPKPLHLLIYAETIGTNVEKVNGFMGIEGLMGETGVLFFIAGVEAFY
jgi:hypothetical protein